MSSLNYTDTKTLDKYFEGLAGRYLKAKWEIAAVAMITFHSLGARDGKIDKMKRVPVDNRIKHAMGEELGRRVTNAALRVLVQYDPEVVAAKSKGTWKQAAEYLGARLMDDFTQDSPGNGWTLFTRPERAEKAPPANQPGPTETIVPGSEELLNDTPKPEAAADAAADKYSSTQRIDAAIAFLASAVKNMSASQIASILALADSLPARKAPEAPTVITLALPAPAAKPIRKPRKKAA